MLFSNISPLTLDQIKKRHNHLQSNNIFYRGNLAFIHKKGSYTYYFISSDQTKQHNKFLLGFMIYTTILFGFSYIILRQLLKPVKELQKGVNEILNGNRKYRVPEQGNDELSDLASSFNIMNDKINKLISIKDRLLIDLAHELKSPLTRIKLALEFTDSETKNTINSDVESLEHITNSILTTFRISFEQNSVSKCNISLIEEIEKVIKTNMMNPAFFNFQLNPSITILANKEMFEVCLKNILDNAIKYSDPAKNPIILQTNQSESSIILTITDFGPGISEEELPYVFEPFYRVDKSRTRSTGGTGLGLSMCKNIADLHNWELKINSKVQNFTRVSIVIPLVK